MNKEETIKILNDYPCFIRRVEIVRKKRSFWSTEITCVDCKTKFYGDSLTSYCPNCGSTWFKFYTPIHEEGGAKPKIIQQNTLF